MNLYYYMMKSWRTGDVGLVVVEAKDEGAAECKVEMLVDNVGNYRLIKCERFVSIQQLPCVRNHWPHEATDPKCFYSEMGL